MFCVECGSEGEVFEALCPSCFFKRKKLVELPGTLDLTLCSSCDSVLVGKKWKRQDIDSTLEEVVSSSLWHNPGLEVLGIRLETRFEDSKNVSADITVRLGLARNVHELHRTTRVRLKSGLCPSCSKLHGKYYEAILQIRSASETVSREKIDETRNYVHTRIEGMSSDEMKVFISKEEQIHGGMDFYLSSNRAAKAIARELGKRYGTKVRSSPKLHGRVDGKDVYRVTYLVRLPAA
jgi:nonsense-mediated mRNA decay protein 3